MKTNILQAMINLQTMRSMTQAGNPNITSSTDTGSMFQQILDEVQQKQDSKMQTLSFQSLNYTTPTVTVKAPEDIGKIIETTAHKYNVDPKLISAIIQQESGFNAEAISKSGAMGLMQLMPKTAQSLGVSDPFDVAQNIEGGTKYISQLLDKYNGNTRLALAAYNAGPGNVDKYNGIPPFQETQNYVRKVLSSYSV
jgi:soluble lytic murein transglycosylase-like protein